MFSFMREKTDSSSWGFGGDAEDPTKQFAQASKVQSGNGFFDKVKNGITNNVAADKMKSMFQGASEHATATINYAKYLPYIILLMVLGGIFIFIAFMFLPLVLISPTKFTFSFAIACSCFLAAIGLIKGDFNAFLWSFLSREKLIYTATYVFSLFGLFAFSIVWPSFILAFIFSAMQIVSSLWVIAISIPGGTKVMELCKMTFKKITECCCNCIYNKSRNALLGEGSS